MPSTSHHSITSDTRCKLQQVGKCPKPMAVTSSYNSDSDISSDNISEEIIAMLESDNEKVNVITTQEDKSTSHYTTMGLPTTCVPVPPTSDVPVKYTVIGGHLKLTTVRIRL